MTYDEIRAAVNAYMHRTDPETVQNEPTAMELARAKLNRWFFPERASELVRDIVTAPNGECMLPVDFGQADTVSTAEGDMFYVTPREFARLTARGDTGGNFTVTGSTLHVDKSISKVSLLYYRQAEDIGTGQTSWLSDDFPDVWIWQSVSEQHRFCQDWESAMAAESYAKSLGDQALLQSRANRGGGSLKMTTRR
jgi:hypothetical protein